MWQLAGPEVLVQAVREGLALLTWQSDGLRLYTCRARTTVNNWIFAKYLAKTQVVKDHSLAGNPVDGDPDITLGDEEHVI